MLFLYSLYSRYSRIWVVCIRSSWFIKGFFPCSRWRRLTFKTNAGSSEVTFLRVQLLCSIHVYTINIPGTEHTRYSMACSGVRKHHRKDYIRLNTMTPGTHCTVSLTIYRVRFSRYKAFQKKIVRGVRCCARRRFCRGDRGLILLLEIFPRPL